MPSIPLHPPSKSTTPNPNNHNNPLPALLQTPSGLAILELQGTINFPTITDDDNDTDMNTNHELQKGGNTKTKIIETELGKIMFPDYSDLMDPDNTKWMKRVYLYVGRYQRMTGEVKKLAKPLAVVRRREPTSTTESGNGDGDGYGEELEIVEVIKYKIIFASRPEPVGLE